MLVESEHYIGESWGPDWGSGGSRFSGTEVRVTERPVEVFGLDEAPLAEPSKARAAARGRPPPDPAPGGPSSPGVRSLPLH